jgi:hypothetical protein
VWGRPVDPQQQAFHQLTQPRTPKANGMVGRFTSGEDLTQTLMRDTVSYHHPSPQAAMND